MLNQFVCVGRIVEKNKVNSKDKSLIITLAVPGSLKNKNGEYDNDYIDCLLKGNVSEATNDYCEKGDLVGIKGRIKRTNPNDEMIVITEKVTFLSNKKKTEEKEIIYD